MFDQIQFNPTAPGVNGIGSWNLDTDPNLQNANQADSFGGIAAGIQSAYQNPDGSYTIVRTKPGETDPMKGQIGTWRNGGVSDWQDYTPDSNSKFFGDMLKAGAIAGGALYGLGAFGPGVGVGATPSFSGNIAGAVGGGGAGAEGLAIGQAAAGLPEVGGSGLLAGTGGTGLVAGTGGSGLAGAGGIGAGIGSSIPLTTGVGAAGAAGGGLMSTIGGFLGTNPTTTANLIGNGISTLGGLYAQNQAVKAQVNAANQANALQKSMFDQIRTDNLPALQARNAGLTGYQNLLANPASVTSDPGYQFGFNQGQAAYDNSGAARGMRLSGAQAKALTRYGQDYAGTKYDNALNRYGNLAGLGQVGSGTIANAGQNYANSASQNITGAGNAAAAGYIGGANTISGGVNNFLRSWNENNLLKQIGIGG